MDSTGFTLNDGNIIPAVGLGTFQGVYTYEVEYQCLHLQYNLSVLNYKIKFDFPHLLQMNCSTNV